MATNSNRRRRRHRHLIPTVYHLMDIDHGVLVAIDDNLTDATQLRDALETTTDTELITVFDAVEAIEAVYAYHPDAIVIDVHHHNAGIEELVTVLRADPATAALPIIVLVSDVDTARLTRARRLDANTIIVKPDDAATLAEAILTATGLG